VSTPRSNDPEAEERRRILKRATLYVYGFIGAGLVVAVAGAALIALLLRSRGLPFFKTWVVLALVILVPAGLALVWREVRERT